MIVDLLRREMITMKKVCNKIIMFLTTLTMSKEAIRLQLAEKKERDTINKYLTDMRLIEKIRFDINRLKINNIIKHL